MSGIRNIALFIHLLILSQFCLAADGFRILSSTDTILGRLECVENGRFKWEIRLGGKKIRDATDYTTILHRMSKPIPPYDDVIVLGQHNYGSTYANQPSIEFMGLNRNGRYEFSELIPYEVGDDPKFQVVGDAVGIDLPGGYSGKGYYYPPSFWVFKAGKLSEIVSTNQALFNGENNIDVFISTGHGWKLNKGTGSFVIPFAVRNNVRFPLNVMQYCPNPWLIDNSLLQVDMGNACTGEEIPGVALNLPASGYYFGTLTIKSSKPLMTGPIKFRIGLNGMPHGDYYGERWSNQLDVQVQ